MARSELSLAEWDWVISPHGERLHDIVVADDPDWLEGDMATAGVSRCGVRSKWWHIPGMFTRMGAQRCSKCCDMRGFPRGIGSPKNDKACRAILAPDEQLCVRCHHRPLNKYDDVCDWCHDLDLQGDVDRG